MRKIAQTLGAGVVLMVSCWTARPETTNATLNFYIVSQEKVANGRFIDTRALPKVGYVAGSPDLIIPRIQDVYVPKIAKNSVMFDTNGTPRLVPNRPSPSLGILLHTNDIQRLTALTERALNKRLLIMLGEQPLSAPTVVAPIETGSFTIGFESEAELKKTQDDLKKLIR